MRKEKMDLDRFGKILDSFLMENEVGIMASFPAGTLEPTIESNVPGAVMQFYLSLYMLKKIIAKLKNEMHADENEWPKVVSGILEIVKNEVLERPNEYTPDCVKEE